VKWLLRMSNERRSCVFFSLRARTLSGVLRLSPRRSQLTLKVQLELLMLLPGRS
jgi:hypothetical protein